MKKPSNRGDFLKTSVSSKNGPLALFQEPVQMFKKIPTSLLPSRRDFLKALGAGASAISLSSCRSLARVLGAEPRHLPNFVILFADDQGYGDLGCFGARGFETPNLDGMASEGMRFTSFYVSQAVCSASRASLLTGCYPNRVGIFGALGPASRVGLHPREETLAEVLKKRGYKAGIFGKWHLGDRREFLPLQHGFDEYLGLPYSNDMWPVDYDGKPLSEKNPGSRPHKLNYPPLPLREGNEKVAEIWTLEDQSWLTRLYTERAVRFIENNRERPFLLYVAHSMPHVPLGVSGKFRGQSRQGMYGDVIMEIDWSVGEILRALDNNGIGEKTLVVFASDNGPWLNFGNHAGSAGPLREGKGTSWEGGVRVPCIMRWPERIPPGTVCPRMAATLDILPTFAAISRAPLPEHKIDGVNILPLLEGRPDADPRDHLFYYYGKELQAVRQGRWKLHFPHSFRSYQGVAPGMDGYPGPYATGQAGLELYDLESDVGERSNVAGEHPEVVERLQALGEIAREDLGEGGRIGRGVRPAGRAAGET